MTRRTDKDVGDWYADACERWPGLGIEASTYADYLRDRVPADANLERWNTADLYLACACARGVPAALSAIEASCFPAVRAALGHFDAGTTADDVVQVLRERLLVEVAGEPPKITRYSGRGSLVSWMRVAAVRTAISLKRQHKRELLGKGDVLARVPDLSEGPELAYLKGKYRHEFKRAFETALAELTPRQRTLLRLNLIDGLTIDQLGELRGVHRATCARWLKDIRDQIGIRTKELLRAGLAVNVAELDSILRLIGSRLDASICRFLQTSD